MNKYENELHNLKMVIDTPDIDYTDYKGYEKITTGGKSYLVIPNGDKNYDLALDMCQFGYVGNLAVYLEIEYSAIKFLNNI
jgi:hypothetical protein